MAAPRRARACRSTRASGSGWCRTSSTRSPGSARSSRCCGTRASPTSWSTPTPPSTSSAAASWSSRPCASATTSTCSTSSTASSRAVGRRVDETSPMVDARLPDGSRVNAIIPPLAIDGPVLSIRRFGAAPAAGPRPGRHRLARRRVPGLPGGLREGQAQHPHHRRHRHRQDHAAQRALGLHSRRRAHRHHRGLRRAAAAAAHVVRLETRPPNIEGKGEIVARDLVRNACACAPTGSSSARSAATRSSTCCRP